MTTSEEIKDIAITLVNSGFVERGINNKTKEELVRITDQGLITLDLLTRLIK